MILASIGEGLGFRWGAQGLDPVSREEPAWRTREDRNKRKMCRVPKG